MSFLGTKSFRNQTTSFEMFNTLTDEKGFNIIVGDALF